MMDNLQSAVSDGLKRTQFDIFRRNWLLLILYVLSHAIIYLVIDEYYWSQDWLYYILSIGLWALDYLLLLYLMSQAGAFKNGRSGGLITYLLTQLLLSLVVIVGLLILILPGLYLLLRWLAAIPDSLVSGGVTNALGRSWDVTGPYQNILAVWLAGPILLFAVGMAGSMLPEIWFDEANDGVVFMADLANSAGLAWLIILSVATYMTLKGTEDDSQGVIIKPTS